LSGEVIGFRSHLSAEEMREKKRPLSISYIRSKEGRRAKRKRPRLDTCVMEKRKGKRDSTDLKKKRGKKAYPEEEGLKKVPQSASGRPFRPKQKGKGKCLLFVKEEERKIRRGWRNRRYLLSSRRSDRLICVRRTFFGRAGGKNKERGGIKGKRKLQKEEGQTQIHVSSGENIDLEKEGGSVSRECQILLRRFRIARKGEKVVLQKRVGKRREPPFPLPPPRTKLAEKKYALRGSHFP